ncbi:MAG: DUF2785 domain-containing protein [Pseudomonadota bacterium]
MRILAFPASVVWVAAGCCAISQHAETRDCLPQYSHAALETLAINQFSIGDAEADALALALSDCLGESDPFLRDDIGYTGFARLLRSEKVSAETIKKLNRKLQVQLTTQDDDGFQQPFASLALAEIVRADRIGNIFSDAERTAIVTTATDYVRQVIDYRGFSDEEGWRHGVAHGADLLMQLVLNPHINDTDIPALVDAALSQVGANHSHAYVFGEPRRLARPVLFAMQREVMSDDDWAERFSALTEPDGQSWDNAYGSESSLARLHNTRAFMLSIYASIAESEQPVFESLRPIVRASLASLP